MSGRGSRALTGAVIATLVLIEVDLFFARLAGHGYLNSAYLTGSQKLALFCLDASLTASLALPCFWVASLLLVRARGRIPAAAGISLLLAPLSLFLSISWFLFRGTGNFIDVNGILFAAGNLRQILSHEIPVQGVRGAVLVAAALAVPGLLLLFGHRIAGRLSPPLGHRVALAGVLVELVLPAVVFAGLTLSPPAGNGGGVSDRIYPEKMRYGTGPVTALAFDLFRFRIAGNQTGGARPVGEWTQRPRVPLGDYLASVSTADRPRVNVVLVMVESLRADVPEAVGGEAMPNLRALAERSLCFTRARTQSTHSDYADLVPLSSLYPLRHERHYFYPAPYPFPRVMLYDILKGLGYRTAVISSQDERWGEMRAFLDTGGIDYFFDAGSAAGQTYRSGGDTGFDEKFPGGKIDDRITVDQAIRWIGEEQGRPFLLSMNLQRSHFPYTWPDGFEPRFSPWEIDFPISFANYPRDKTGVMRNRYLNALSYVDLQLGRLIRAIEDQGQLDRTLIVVSGDTGQGFNEHGLLCHGGPLYDEFLRVPLMMSLGTKLTGTSDTVAGHIDIAPTIIGILGFPPHPSFQGIDLLSAPPGGRNLFCTAQTSLADQDAIVSGRYKLIRDYRYRRDELYDLLDDPGERHDLFLELPSVSTELGGRVAAYRLSQLAYYADRGRFDRFFAPRLH